jgi:hypothetical protein
MQRGEQAACSDNYGSRESDSDDRWRNLRRNWEGNAYEHWKQKVHGQPTGED